MKCERRCSQSRSALWFAFHNLSSVVAELWRSASLMRVALCNSAHMAAAVLTGCLREIHYTSAPGASGRVLDSVDHSPVPDAIVTLIPEVTPETIGLYSHKNVSVTVW